jgi:hypothetical protein
VQVRRGKGLGGDPGGLKWQSHQQRRKVHDSSLPVRMHCQCQMARDGSRWYGGRTSLRSTRMVLT